MKIITGKDIKGADLYTIENEPIESIALMERAAGTIAQAIAEKADVNTPLLFFIGKGNNGGDGLAVARILWNAGFTCNVFMAFGVDGLSEDCMVN